MKRKMYLLFAVIVLFWPLEALGAANFYDWQEPVFLGGDYAIYGKVDLSPPDKVVCVAYSVNSVATATLPCFENGNEYDCRIPKYENSVIEYEISAYSNDKCKSIKTVGIVGSFDTTPTATTIVYAVARNPVFHFCVIFTLFVALLYWMRNK